MINFKRFYVDNCAICKLCLNLLTLIARRVWQKLAPVYKRCKGHDSTGGSINFRKSRRDTFPPVAGGVCAIPNENDYLIINKPLEIQASYGRTRYRTI